MYIELLHIKKIYYFLAVVVLSIFFTYYINAVFVSKSVLFHTYAESLTDERIGELFNISRSYTFISFIILPFIILFRVFYNAAAVSTATLLENQGQYKFDDNFNICLKAELAFILMSIGKIIAFILFKKVTVLTDIGYMPLSALAFFNADTLPKWSLFALQSVNVWELLYCYIGAHLFAKNYGISVGKSIRLFVLPYLTGLLIVVLIVTFLTLQFA
ncbi:hypothetical protein [Mucilaginibacter celer]|uniref:Yip1 domain-containing protein n=1 Tax=Mucilaginibacter celer TaxID=2305508 RepID=A0A494VU54_9SPHI|nr:hypothetical protein [Mucilaginibacter celer]AYL97621.1 hypothetical protein HYN43_021015 [Mucilaginibacter celer]